MTLFYENNIPGPATHALVIGVGGYRHLPGGAEEVPQVIEHIGLMNQLTSPPRSAVAFAQFLLESTNRWTAPLGSIELMLSVAQNDPYSFPDGVTAKLPTRAAIQTAYNEWKDRCNSNTDNIALFYFCGHGFEKEKLLLLTEDFGEDPNNPWLGSFDFTATRIAFNACKAKIQCFFIDACRKLTFNMLMREPTYIPLDTFDKTKITECDSNLTILGAARNETALGPKRSVSFFTQALLRAFRGAVACPGDVEDDWVIKTGNMAVNITDILRTVKPSEGYKQRAIPEGTSKNTSILHVPIPKVPIILECDPSKANTLVNLSCKRVYSPVVYEKHHEGAPWCLELDAGHYEANAQFPPGTFREITKLITARPLEPQYPLRCNL